MSSTIQCYKLTMPIIPSQLLITTGADMLQRFAKSHGLTEHSFIRSFFQDCGMAGGCMPLEGGRILVILPEIYSAEVVFHEALHCATSMWYDIGAELEVPQNDEVLAYTQGYIATYIKEICYAD